MEQVLYILPREGLQATFDNITLLQQALGSIVRDDPPQKIYNTPLKGFWSGPTGIAYLFFHISSQHPTLVIDSKTPLDWAKAYLGEKIPDIPFEPSLRCGISSEYLAHLAVRAVVWKDLSIASDFAESLETIFQTTSAIEWHSGRAGALYLSRLVLHWIPESSEMLEDRIARLRQSIMSEKSDWTFHGKRYIGAAHGDIGTLTQVALSSPTDEEKQKLGPMLARLLEWQKPDGNWPVNEEVDPKPYVQFCHGAPGFVTSLQSIKFVFPEMETKILTAISKANVLIQGKGLLSKEPNLCHGIFGNGLCLPPDTRSNFLAHGLPEIIEEYRRSNAKLFETSDRSSNFSLMTGYWTGLAWTCIVNGEINPTIIGYNDV